VLFAAAGLLALSQSTARAVVVTTTTTPDLVRPGDEVLIDIQLDTEGPASILGYDLIVSYREDIFDLVVGSFEEPLVDYSVTLGADHAFGGLDPTMVLVTNPASPLYMGGPTTVFAVSRNAIVPSTLNTADPIVPESMFRFRLAVGPVVPAGTFAVNLSDANASGSPQGGVYDGMDNLLYRFQNAIIPREDALILVVPEPTAWGLLLVGMPLGAVLLRRGSGRRTSRRMDAGPAA